ncbi:MAG: hypothetical protein R2909_17335 [Gemmatimonadales bacterium]
MIDPANPVVALCARGMEAESGGDRDLAARLFLEAWERAADDYEACIAAHYVARHQSEPAELLRWNQVALQRADRVGDDRVAGFYPSLQLNLGFALERSGDRMGARDAYLAAAARLERLPEDRYGEIVRDGVRRALARVRAAGD